MPPHPSPRTLVTVLLLAEVLGMTGTMTVPALLPVFKDDWGLSNTAAGWLSGVVQLGYVAAVLPLLSLTDRLDSRRIYIVGTALSALSCAGFAAFADGFWSAMAWRAVGGIGLAGTYMPGLRILNDHTAGHPQQSRYLSFYTATYGIGTALSVALAGLLAEWAHWRWAFWTAAALGGLTVLLALRWLPATRPAAPAEPGAVFDFRPVLRNRAAMGYVLAYAAHCWELFGFRAWLVAFLAFALGAPAGVVPAEAAVIGTVAILLGVPASILGNEAAVRWGRDRFLTAIMLASAALAAVIGFTAGLPFALLTLLVLVYGCTVTADSASLTVGLVGAAPGGRRGAAMAIHSLFGFGAAFMAPVAFGLLLDVGGGAASLTGWGLAFAHLGLVVALGPLLLRTMRGA